MQKKPFHIGDLIEKKFTKNIKMLVPQNGVQFFNTAFNHMEISVYKV